MVNRTGGMVNRTGGMVNRTGGTVKRSLRSLAVPDRKWPRGFAEPGTVCPDGAGAARRAGCACRMRIEDFLAVVSGIA